MYMYMYMYVRFLWILTKGWAPDHGRDMYKCAPATLQYSAQLWYRCLRNSLPNSCVRTIHTRETLTLTPTLIPNPNTNP